MNFALEHHIWMTSPSRIGCKVLQGNRRSGIITSDGHLDVDGGYRNGKPGVITPVTIRGPEARWSPVCSPPMARPRKAEASAPTKTLEAQLWAAADQMRGAVPPTDYMHVSLGLVFLRYLSVAFEAKHTELLNTPHADAEDPEEYHAENVFWVPVQSRWSTLAANARSADIGRRIDDAMRNLEADNDALRGVLPKIFGKPDFSSAMLGGLIDHFTNLNLTGAPSDFDLLGRVYEFFLGEFSAMQGKAGVGRTRHAASSPRWSR